MRLYIIKRYKCKYFLSINCLDYSHNRNKCTGQPVLSSRAQRAFE